MLAMVVLGSWAFSSPPGSSPDDGYHLQSIWCAADGISGQCDVDAVEDTVVAPTFLDAHTCFSYQPDESAACQGDEWDLELAVTERLNKGDLYPPGFYTTMALFVGSRPIQSIMTMRLVNAVIAIALFAAVYAVAGRSLRQALSASWLLGSIPLGVFILTSNNPSSWTLIGIGLFWAAFLVYWETDESRTRVVAAALAVATAALAIGSRGDGAAYVLFSMGLVVLGNHLRPGGLAAIRRRSLVLPALIAVPASYVFLTVRQSEVISEGFSEGQEVNPDSVVWFVNLTELPHLWAGAFGGPAFAGLGWLDTPMPSAVWAPMVGAVAMLMYAGLARLDRPKLIRVAILGFALSFMPLWVLARADQFVGDYLQPRYLLPLIYMLLGFALLTPDRDAGLVVKRANRNVIIAAVTVAHSVALHVNIRRYVTGLDVAGLDLNAGREWWWDTAISPMVLWVVASGCFFVLARATIATFAPAPEGAVQAPASRRPLNGAARARADGERVLIA